MTLSADKIERAHQIADVLEERINAVHRLYGSIHTKSDCCKILIEPLLKEYRIDTLLESLPPRAAKPLEEKNSRLMSCFDATGELLNQGLSVTTINRYATDLIKELRDIAEGGKRKDKRRSKEKRNKFGPIDKRFTFGPGQVSFDGRDLNVGTGAVIDIARALVENFGHVVPFQQFDENSLEKEASEKIRSAIRRLRKTIKSASIPVVIENRKGEGYLILPSTK
jgi:hypothetical protein